MAFNGIGRHQQGGKYTIVIERKAKFMGNARLQGNACLAHVDDRRTAFCFAFKSSNILVRKITLRRQIG